VNQPDNTLYCIFTDGEAPICPRLGARPIRLRLRLWREDHPQQAKGRGTGTYCCTASYTIYAFWTCCIQSLIRYLHFEHVAYIHVYGNCILNLLHSITDTATAFFELVAFNHLYGTCILSLLH